MSTTQFILYNIYYYLLYICRYVCVFGVDILSALNGTRLINSDNFGTSLEALLKSNDPTAFARVEVEQAYGTGTIHLLNELKSKLKLRSFNFNSFLFNKILA